MIESGRTAGAARVDVEADIAITDGDGAAGPGLVGGPHAERGDVELRQLGVVFAHDRHVVDLGEHGTSLAAVTFRLVVGLCPNSCRRKSSLQSRAAALIKYVQ